MPDLTDEVDITGGAVSEWLAANSTPVGGLVVATTVDHGGIATYRFEVSAPDEPALAQQIAIGVVAQRLAQRPSAFASWVGAIQAGVLDAHEALVRLHVKQMVGTPAKPRLETDLFAMVAEHLLWRLLNHIDRGLGLPVHIEGHDWDVTDHGGDSVAVYRTPTGFAFRLWESKAVTGAHSSPKAAVGKATGQLTRKGWEYLARWATVARRLPDEHLAEFFVLMPDLWKLADGRAGAGVAISTHTTKPTDACFDGLAGKFNLPDANKQGNLVVAGDFAQLSRDVRSVIWKGAGWSAP